MTDVQKQVLISRVKSFLWRGAAFLLVAAISWLTKEVASWNIPIEYQTIAALLLGELTKYVNSNIPWMNSQVQ